MISADDIHKASILVVDEQDEDGSALEQILREADYVSVASTKEPHTVCELHRQNHYDLILLDLHMPGMDGFEVMESLKEIEAGGHLPVLVITAQPGHKLRALKAGAKDFVSKPFDLAEVLMRVHNMLEVRLLHQNESRLNQTRLENSQRIAGLGDWQYDFADKRLAWSDEVYRILGILRHDFPPDSEMFYRQVHPDDLDFVHREKKAAAAGLRRVDFEHRIVRPSGEVRYIHQLTEMILDSQGQPLRECGTLQDITERRISEDALRESEGHFRFLHDLGEATRALSDPAQIMAVLARMLGGHLHASRCAYADVEKDGERFTILHDYTDGCASTVGTYRLSLFGSRAAAWLRGGQTLIVRDVDAELLPAEGADVFNAIGIKAIISCPLIKDGVLCAMMAIHQTTPRDWKTGEIALVQEVVERSWATIMRRKAEENLRRSETLLRVAGRTARVGGWVVDLPDVRVTWSDEVCAIQDVPPGTAPALEEAFNFYVPQSREIISQAFAICALEGTSFDLELEMITAQGRPIWVRSIGEAQRNAAGVITAVGGAFQDITARKISEGALRTSEQRFKALFEQAAVGVALAEPTTGRLVQINQRFCTIVGRSRKELEQITFASITHPDDLDRDLENMRQLRAGTIREFTSEKRYLRPDHSEVWASLTVSAMWAPGEPPDLCIAVVQDVTGRKQLEEQFRQTQKMEAIGTLAGGIAHDFNNILTAIVGYTELSKMALSATSEIRAHLDAVLRASGRATDLVRQILTFSRQQPQERRAIQLRPVVAESLELLRAAIPSSIQFDVSLAEDAPVVFADANQIHQILMNLGTNAWYAMKDCPGRLQMKLERCVVDETHVATQPRLRQGIYARISVSDTGCGMDQATLQRIFEPFFTTKPAGQGTGLGLAVVHGIMENHDGAVTVYSQPGEGTVFHLYFPVHAGEAAAMAVQEGPVPRGRGERLLFVDDEDLLAHLGQKTLTALGYVVEIVSEPTMALAMVRAEPRRFALVLTDQTMPGMTGLLLASQLRRIRPGLPVILMTGYSLSLTPERIEAAGVCQLLLKPTGVHSLGFAVHSALSASSASAS